MQMNSFLHIPSSIKTKFSILFLAFLLGGSGVFAFQQPKGDLADYVNTLQGTNSKFELTRGNTYPTTALPFGMNTWTPQTGANGDGWKYQYFKDSIRGFQQAHQCSSWTNDYAVFSLMPEIGKLQLSDRQRGASFRHKNEIARPYSYQVTFDNGIKTEMSPTERGAHIRFSFPKNEEAFLVLDGYTGTSSVKIDPKKRQITGYVRNGRGMKRIEGMKNYFVIQFDKAFKTEGIWENRGQKKWEGKLSEEGEGIGAFVRFKDGAEVQAKVASSYISPEQAKLNLERELGDFKRWKTLKRQPKRYGISILGKLKLKAEPKSSLRPSIPVFSGPACSPENSMKLMKMESLTITAPMMERYMMVICIPIPASGIPFGHSFL